MRAEPSDPPLPEKRIGENWAGEGKRAASQHKAGDQTRGEVKSQLIYPSHSHRKHTAANKYAESRNKSFPIVQFPACGPAFLSRVKVRNNQSALTRHPIDLLSAHFSSLAAYFPAAAAEEIHGPDELTHCFT